MLNELGNSLEYRISHRRAQIENYSKKQMWEKCLEIRGEINAFENVWELLMSKGLLSSSTADQDQEGEE